MGFEDRSPPACVRSAQAGAALDRPCPNGAGGDARADRADAQVGEWSVSGAEHDRHTRRDAETLEAERQRVLRRHDRRQLLRRGDQLVRVRIAPGASRHRTARATSDPRRATPIANRGEPVIHTLPQMPD